MTEITIRNDYPIVEASNLANVTQGMSPSDIIIPSVKFPSGGATVWQIDDGTGEVRNAETLSGVVVNHYSHDSLYLETYDQNPDAKAEATWVGGQPTWISPEAVAAGIEPNLPINEQPLNKFGSNLHGGTGKAISNRWIIYLVEAGEVLPVRLSVPPMSRKVWASFQMRAYISKPATAYVTEFSLKSLKNKQGKPFSELVVKKAAELDEATAAAYAELAESLRPITEYRTTSSDTKMAIVGEAAVAENVNLDNDLPF